MADSKEETNKTNNNNDITDKVKKVDNKGQTNNTDITDKIKNILVGGFFANGLAVLLILGVVVAIVALIIIHQHTLDLNQKTYEKILATVTNKIILFPEICHPPYCNHFKIIIERLIFRILI